MQESNVKDSSALALKNIRKLVKQLYALDKANFLGMFNCMVGAKSFIQLCSTNSTSLHSYSVFISNLIEKEFTVKKIYFAPVIMSDDFDVPTYEKDAIFFMLKPINRDIENLLNMYIKKVGLKCLTKTLINKSTVPREMTIMWFYDQFCSF